MNKEQLLTVASQLKQREGGIAVAEDDIANALRCAHDFSDIFAEHSARVRIGALLDIEPKFLLQVVNAQFGEEMQPTRAVAFRTPSGETHLSFNLRAELGKQAVNRDELLLAEYLSLHGFPYRLREPRLNYVEIGIRYNLTTHYPNFVDLRGEINEDRIFGIEFVFLPDQQKGKKLEDPGGYFTFYIKEGFKVLFHEQGKVIDFTHVGIDDILTFRFIEVAEFDHNSITCRIFGSNSQHMTKILPLDSGEVL